MSLKIDWNLINGYFLVEQYLTFNEFEEINVILNLSGCT